MAAGTAPWDVNDWKRWRFVATLLILAVTAIRVAYLFLWCPLDLVPDEAHYWDWSRHLDWSYYSKGPLVAWLIRASCEVFGNLSVSITGSEMPAVRIPAVASGSLMLIGLYLLTVQIFADERLAFLVVVGMILQPVVALGSLLMTIDAPFTCCWTWALVVGYRAIQKDDFWAWILTGLLVGIGILAKYTMALWLFSLGLFLIATPGFRSILQRRNFWLMIGVVVFCCVPILIWNWKNDWVSVRHVAVQAGVPTETKNQGFRWWGPFEYLGTQFGILLGYWFVIWAVALVVFRPGRTANVGIRFLWWMSLPTFVVFGLVTFKSAGQPNWPISAYLAGIPLAAAWIWQQINQPAIVYQRLARFGLVAAGLLGFVGILILHNSRPARPLMAEVVGPPTPKNPFPLRKLDPTCRLRGWQFLASQVDEIRQSVLKQEGTEALVTGVNWTTPGELGFYCAGHPTVYSIGLALGDRHSQYDLWQPNPVSDAQAFRGRTFVLVGPVPTVLQEAFDSLERKDEVVYREDGQPIASWSVAIGRGYRGFGSSNQANPNHY